MPDYGHPLQFGTFITPTASDPGRVVDLAVVTETSGLDIVSFQDHPYQADFLDMWTLLSFVAARTSHVQLLPNVLNLPLRPAPVLARSAASLDLLSGGRLILGLGTGAFWDAIVSMGGQKRSPGESIEQLLEAIDILRQSWDTETRGMVRTAGDYYPVQGMRRGPAPAHDIPLWLGAYGKRMLKITGEQANGWVPSMGYIEIDAIPEANARIDDAANSSGRSPAHIVRALNINGSFLRARRGFLKGTPASWADDLTELALRDGVSTFLLGAGDPDDIRTFGEEVAPVVRERVAKGRGTDDDPRQTPAATEPDRMQRTTRPLSENIEYASIPSSFGRNAITPENSGYDRVRSSYMGQGTPGVVLLAESVEQVAEALAWAQRQDVPLSVRSGGHGPNGISTNDGGIVIDVGQINDIEVLDEPTRRIRVGAGATWGMVAQAIAPYGWAMTSGDFPDVGVGGLATTGGIGLLGRKYGLTLDNVIAADVVLADGRIVRVSATEQPDLFWGIRGAGPNLGIVTHIEMTALPVENVVYASFAFDASRPADLLFNWGMIMEHAPRELQSFLYLMPRGRGGPMAQALAVWSNDDGDAAVKALEPFLEIAPVLQQGAQLVPYSVIMQPHDQMHSGQQTLKMRSGLIDRLSRDTADAIERLIQAGRVPWAQFRHTGGAINDVPGDATAWAWRSSQVCFTATDINRDLRNLNPAWEGFAPHAHGTYQNLESLITPEIVHEVYPSPTYERVQRLKTEFDPTNVFRQNFNVPPDAGR